MLLHCGSEENIISNAESFLGEPFVSQHWAGLLPLSDLQRPQTLSWRYTMTG